MNHLESSAAPFDTQADIGCADAVDWLLASGAQKDQARHKGSQYTHPLAPLAICHTHTPSTLSTFQHMSHHLSVSSN